MIKGSLSSRILWWSILWCAVILSMYTAVYTYSFYHRSLQSYRHVLQLEVDTLIGQGVDKLASSIDTTNWERYAAVTDSAFLLRNQAGLTLMQVGSHVFTDARMQEAMSNLPSVTYLKPSATLTWGKPMVWKDATGTHHALAATRTVVFADQSEGQLFVMSLTDAILHETRRTLYTLLVIDVIVLVLFGLGMRWLTYQGLRPVRRLIEGVQAVEWGQAERLHLGAIPSEIDSLQQSVNGLLDRLNSGVKEQNRFIADASHELRTPLAIIAGHANLLRRWGRQNEKVWEPAVRNIVSEVERLQKLVNQLLALARLEEAPERYISSLNSEDIRALFHSLREDASVLRPDLNFETVVHMTSKSRLRVATDDLRQVLLGLLDNAMRHTPAGGKISLTAHGDEGKVRFTVSDTGEGIPQDVLPHIFDRFYRSDSARTQTKGSGLGLAIGKQVIESYHGKVMVRSRPKHGTTVVLLIPINDVGTSEQNHITRESENDGHA